MKTIIVYSGKGGVGKTTTSANVAKILVEQGKKVFIVDADINTPSMGVIFGSDKPSDSLRVASTSFKYKGLIYFEKSAVRKFLYDTIQEIREFNPDYVIIDTPPSITDVHINLIKTFKVSGILIVTQPSEISRADVNRTASFFTERAPGAGVLVIENMVQSNSPSVDYLWPLVAKIPFVESFSGEQVFEEHKEKYKEIIHQMVTLNMPDVIQEVKKKMLFDESITIADLPSEDERMSPKEMKFINVNTWDEIRWRIQETNRMGLSNDQFLEVNTAEKVGRLLKAFEFDTEANFMITNAPNTEIDVFPGEIGRGVLFVAESYYGVPRIKYQTGSGELVLFPHEVMPADEKEVALALSDGYTVLADGRYIPPRKSLEEVYHAFGNRVGMRENWEEKYEKLISQKEEKFQPVNSKLADKVQRKKERQL